MTESVLPFPPLAAETVAGMTLSDRDAIVVVATDYVESFIDGDSRRMASCLHPALAKRRVLDHEAPMSSLVETSFGYMTTDALSGGPKPIAREIGIEILDLVEGIATAKVISEPFVDLLHLARFGDRWLIVNALWEGRPAADRPGEPVGAAQALEDYSRSWFDRDVEAARSAVHPALIERRLADPSGGSLDLDENTFEELLQIVKAGPDEPIERAWKASVLDVSHDMASGKVGAAWWDIYLHLARFADRWMIVNILYRSTSEPS